MKTIKVLLAGHCEVFQLDNPMDGVTAEQVAEYSYMNDMVEDGIVADNRIELSFMKNIHRLTWRVDNGDDEDREFGEPSEDEIMIEKKGKYIKTTEYFAEFIQEPFVVQHSDSTYAEYEYSIELMDDEDFDPLKLQLIKSDYEVEFLPYGIITGTIMYDGRAIPTDTECCFDEYAESDCFLYNGFGRGCRYQW